MHKPKPVRDHYTESLQVNSANLAKQMAGVFVPEGEAASILSAILSLYMAEVDRIAMECEHDMMALEKVPTPLKLFVDCIAKVDTASQPAKELLGRYVSAWEDWM